MYLIFEIANALTCTYKGWMVFYAIKKLSMGEYVI